jgi:hypothetical protein
MPNEPQLISMSFLGKYKNMRRCGADPLGPREEAYGVAHAYINFSIFYLKAADQLHKKYVKYLRSQGFSDYYSNL